MSASTLGPRRRDDAVETALPGVVPGVGPQSPEALTGAETGSSEAVGFSAIELQDSTRISLMLTPQGRGAFQEQVEEVLASQRTVLARQPQPMTVTTQTVFLSQAAQQQDCERLFAAHYGPGLPVTNYVLQPPCGGAAMALEAWAIGGESVRIERFGANTLAVNYAGLRWVYCAGVRPERDTGPVYERATEMFRRMEAELEQAGSRLDHAVRTWFYLGGITEPENQTQRYHELNRARSDFYHGLGFGRALLRPGVPQGIYPASTGIGTAGSGLTAGCVTVQTRRADTFLAHLENPQQTPAYAYHSRYSPLSPKFSRALALAVGNRLITWISGTASIVNSESRHLGDIRGQTEQTIENIERLIGPENFALHGMPGAGAGLHDLRKIRVYLKRPEDYLECKTICERRLGSVPAIYALADICRPELLVEIEGIAFSRLGQP